MTTRYTGHPSPAVQVARRVGTTAGGYTLGVETPDGARLFCGPVRRVAVPEPAPAPEPSPRSPAKRSDALLHVLLNIGPVLPTLTELGRAVGLYDDAHSIAGHVLGLLGSLERRGLIRWWRGSQHGCHGQHAVAIVATGAVLRSAGCPAAVVP